MTFEDIKNRAITIVSDDSSATSTLLGELINETHKHICGMRDWSFTEDEVTLTTTTNQSSITIPAGTKKIIGFKVTVGGIDYAPQEVKDPIEFDRIRYNGTTQTSSYPSYYNIFNNTIQVYPTISDSGNTITIKRHKTPQDQSAVDYTTGTITTLANGGTAVTGSGTTWTSAMIGRFIKIGNSDWYKITAVGSTTTLTIAKPYLGTAISAGSETYVIGELPLVPEEFHDLLWYRPVGMYLLKKSQLTEAAVYFSNDKRRPGLYESQLRELEKAYATKTTSGVSRMRRVQLSTLLDPWSTNIT